MGEFLQMQGQGWVCPVAGAFGAWAERLLVELCSPVAVPCFSPFNLGLSMPWSGTLPSALSQMSRVGPSSIFAGELFSSFPFSFLFPHPPPPASNHPSKLLFQVSLQPRTWRWPQFGGGWRWGKHPLNRCCDKPVQILPSLGTLALPARTGEQRGAARERWGKARLW